jgi:hypothetical protein
MHVHVVMHIRCMSAAGTKYAQYAGGRMTDKMITMRIAFAVAPITN